VNRRAEEFLGSALPISLPSRWDELFSVFAIDQKTRLPPEANPILRALRGEETQPQDVFIRNGTAPDGVMLAIAGTPLRDAKNTLAGGVVVLRDVTQQRRLEQQLLQAQKMEAVGQLAGGVAHDFNNLLSVIKSYGELLLEGLPESDRKRDDLAEMLHAAERAAVLTRQLLAFSRRQVVHPRILELNAIVANIEKMLGRVLGEHISLATALQPDLWRVRADGGQIEQIIVNLGVNARDAMPGGGKLTIETANTTVEETYPGIQAGLAPGDFVLLTVTDTGSGMSVETQSRIFEPFFTTKEVGRGTGLGLSTVYGIVQQAGGHIWVYSELGRGTTFKVYLPRVHEPCTPTTERPPPRAARQGTSERILLLEDQDAVRHIAARILRAAGYHVFEAKQASEAKIICAEWGARIDLLLTDVIMPEQSGPDLAVELLRSWPRMRVLYMSGYSGTAMMRQGAFAPGTALLEKPFSPDSLNHKVREVLDACASGAPEAT
ncbi:MAG TPA: ATP-binding protein, partial [Polyangiaceae bacterium]|nr:ATP-binding protein [Polyangiaceae bacterium]